MAGSSQRDQVSGRFVTGTFVLPTFDMQEVARLYLVEKQTVEVIANGLETNCTHLYARMAEAGIPRRSRRESRVIEQQNKGKIMSAVVGQEHRQIGVGWDCGPDMVWVDLLDCGHSVRSLWIDKPVTQSEGEWRPEPKVSLSRGCPSCRILADQREIV